MGLHFEILAVESDQVYECRGRIQRLVGIRPQWHHHSNAIRVPESVFTRFSEAFRATHGKFNYYGPTEYKSQEIARLCNALRARPWPDGKTESVTQGETKDVVCKILAVAEHALTNQQSLLVLGI